MCGIAGIVDRSGGFIDPEALGRMARAILHRGPDEAGQLLEPGLGLISQRLQIVGLHDGRQPISNEDGSLAVVYNGELFDYPEQKRELEARGHVFRTHADTELLVHLWEEHGEQLFSRLKGQFAFALLDRKRRVLILARDRLGICPLFVTQRGSRWLFGSEIKALLASGEVPAEVDRLGLDHVFSFFAMGTRRTMFRGIRALLPGHYLRLPLDEGPAPEERQYWDLDFPDRGSERPDSPELLEEFGDTLMKAVSLRLRADVPVVSYLSGGVDSSTIAFLASRALGRPIPTFTIQIKHPGLDETDRTRVAAAAIGTVPEVLACGEAEIASGYPALVVSSECPVIDTSSAAIHQLAARVHARGYKVALTGEGADEALAGYPWFKVRRWLALLGPLGEMVKRFYMTYESGRPWSVFHHRYERMGGVHATSDLYATCSVMGDYLFSRAQREAMAGYTAPDDLVLNLDRMRCWDPLNRSLYLGYKVMLAGLLMTHKGDRPAMAHSVETRFPFLDEDLVALCASISPRLKLRGFVRDKDLLRRYARQFLPPAIAERPKHIFRARYTGSFLDPEPAWVSQLLSRESLLKTGYFHVGRVHGLRQRFRRGGKTHPRRSMGAEVALVGAISTQLWHHLFLGGGLCELPTWSCPA